jgi:streptogramin lyase
MLITAGGPGASGASGAVASPATLTELAKVDLPGPVYDLAYDRASNSLWYAYMTSGAPDALYRYDITTGHVAKWPLPPTDHNGFLERVALAPDGSVWVTEEYSVVRVDPVSGGVAAHTFPVADADALSAALQTSPGTWPSAITFDSQGLAMVARHNVKSLVRLNSSLSVVDRIQLPAGMVGPGDLVDSNGVVYAAPYTGDGQAVVFSEKGVLIGTTAQKVSRFSVSGGEVASIGTTGLSRVRADASMASWLPRPGGTSLDLLALTDGGAAVYEYGPGAIEWVSPAGAVEGRLALAAVLIQVGIPFGTPETVLGRHEVGAIAADKAGSIWYVDATSSQLVHVGL